MNPIDITVISVLFSILSLIIYLAVRTELNKMYLKNLEKKFEYHIRKLYKRIVRLEKVVFNINNNFNSIKTSSLNEKLNVCNNKRDTINSEKNKE